MCCVELISSPALVFEEKTRVKLKTKYEDINITASLRKHFMEKAARIGVIRAS